MEAGFESWVVLLLLLGREKVKTLVRFGGEGGKLELSC